MSRRSSEVLIEALTRSNMPRDALEIRGSDEELLRKFGADLGAGTLHLLADTSKLLRLMDALLAGSENGEGFVSKFSNRWAFVKRAHGVGLGEQAARLDQFYGDIQLFCATERGRREEPSLFGRGKLEALTRPVYAQFKRWWCDQLPLET